MSLFGPIDIKAVIDALEHSPDFLAWLNANIQPTGNPIVLNGPVVGPGGGPVDFSAGIQTPFIEFLPSFGLLDIVPAHSIYYVTGELVPRWNSSAAPAVASSGTPLGGVTGNTIITSVGNSITVAPIVGGYNIEVNPAAPSATSITAGPGIAVTGDGSTGTPYNISALGGGGTVTSVTSGNSGISIGGTATDPTVSLVPGSPLLPEVVAGTNVTSVIQTFDGIDGHAIYTVNIPAPGTGTVTSVTSGNSAIVIGGTATNPTVSIAPASPLLPEVVAGTNVTSVVQTFDGIDGHAIYTVNIPSAGAGTVTSVSSGNSAIAIGGTAADPTVSLVPNSPLLPEVVAGTNVTSVVQTFDGIDGHAIYTVNIPAAGSGTVTSVTSGNSGIVIGGTATDPTVSIAPASPLLPEVVAGTNVTSVVQTFDGIDGHAIYTVNIPAAGTGTVTSVTSGNSAIAIGGTAADPTVSIVPGSPLLPEVVAGTNITSVVQTFDGIDGHAIYTVNAPASVSSVTAGNASIVVGGTATAPTVAVAPNFVTTAALSGLVVTGGPVGPYNLALDGANFPSTLLYWTMGTSIVAGKELSSWTPVNAAADADIALLPKGAGGISQRNYATSTNVGGLLLGAGAVDLQATSAVGNVGYVTGANGGVFAGLQGIVTGASSVILGGGTATVGQGNTVNAAQSGIVAGIQGVINVGSVNSVLAGGVGNVIGDAGAGTNQRATIVGGNLNAIQNGTAAGINNFIVGGLNNIVGNTAGNFATTSCGIVGGGFNQLTGASLRSVIIGGGSNVLPAGNVITACTNAAILGGTAHSITSSTNSIAAGGNGHTITGGNACAIGGQTLTVSATGAACVGGATNTADAANSATLGGVSNTVQGLRAVCMGGNNNTNTATACAIVAGINNNISNLGINGVVVGGDLNNVNGQSSAVGAGSGNDADGPTGFIAAGTENNIVAGISNGFIGGGDNQTAAGTNGVTNVASVGGSHTTNSASNSIMTGSFGTTKSCSVLEDSNKIQIAGGSASNHELITILGRNKSGQGAIVTSGLHSSHHSTCAYYMEWDEQSLGAVGLTRGALVDGNNKKSMLGYMVCVDDKGLISKANSIDEVVGVTVTGDDGLVGGGKELFYRKKYLCDEFGIVIVRDSYLESVYKVLPKEIRTALSLDRQQLASLQFATPAEICERLKAKFMLDSKDGEKILDISHECRQVAVLDPSFDERMIYTSRSGRAEWSAVAHSGSAVVRDDGSCIIGRRCVPENGVATNSLSNQGYRVVSRLGNHTIVILL